ncbi:MAG: T9SS type A sorting domain-containing protein, partial [Bacteroidales bacterium]|nr:T9SS type A sorting domain-containing protein [Bacteroidales bacterium]
AQIAVSEKGAPTVNVTSITQSTCGNTDGSILIAAAGGTGSFTYDWKDGTGSSVGSDEDLTGVGPGEYNVSVSDGSGCKTFATATIPAELPPTEMISLVTVDTVSGKNVIVWNETPGKGITAYRLYRETTSAGVFDSIAYISVDSLSTYTDLFADPVIRSWRYRLAAINNCGVESRLSPPHKTMHLTINLGLLDHINLIWNHYEGYVPKDNNYKIWRHTPGIGWDMIDVVPSNLNSYTDETAPDEDLWYYVEAEHSSGCTPLKAATYNSSRSNRKTKFKVAPAAIGSFINKYNLVVYPNPSEGLFKLMMDIDQVEDLNIKVFDLSGKLVYLEELRNINNRFEHDIDLTGLEKGMYQLYLKTDTGMYNKTIVIQ